MYLRVPSCESTGLAAAEPTAFSQPPSGPQTHCHAAHKVQFHDNHLQPVEQTPQNYSAPGTRSSALLAHTIGSAYYFSGYAQSRGQARGYSATNTTPEATSQAKGPQYADD